MFYDAASQHESPTYNCSSGVRPYKLDGDCPYVGQQLLQKVSESKQWQILKLLLMMMVLTLMMIDDIDDIMYTLRMRFLDCWWWQPHIGGGKQFRSLLSAGLTVLVHFFLQIVHFMDIMESPAPILAF